MPLDTSVKECPESQRDQMKKVGLADWQTSSGLPSASDPESVKCQYVRIPPGYRVGACPRPVKARPDASAVWGHPLRTTVNDALLSETWRSGNGFGLAHSVFGRAQRRIEDL